MEHGILAWNTELLVSSTELLSITELLVWNTEFWRGTRNSGVEHGILAWNTELLVSNTEFLSITELLVWNTELLGLERRTLGVEHGTSSSNAEAFAVERGISSLEHGTSFLEHGTSSIERGASPPAVFLGRGREEGGYRSPWRGDGAGVAEARGGAAEIARARLGLSSKFYIDRL